MTSVAFPGRPGKGKIPACPLGRRFCAYTPALKRVALFPTCLFIFSLLLGCSVAPSESTVRELITRHFEARNYRVVELETADVSSVPLGRLRYMGTRGYVVEVRKITLDVTEDIGSPPHFKKGERLTFKDGRIMLRESDDRKGSWVIANISGILLP